MVIIQNTNHRYYQSLKKKKRMRNRITELAKGQVKISDTKNLIFTLIILILVFVIIAYFKPQ